MGIFPLDFKKTLLIIFMITLPLISINIKRNPSEIAWYLKPIYFVSSASQNAFTYFSNQVKGSTSTYLNLIDIKKDNKLMKEKVRQLQAELLQASDIKKENNRLRELMGFKQHSSHTLLASKVIGYDLFSSSGQSSTIKINKGIQDGAKPGLGVITPDGVVGSILSADQHFSQVLLLTDRYSIIDAVVERTRARGIVEGDNIYECRLKYLQRTDDVKVNDQVITTGLDNIFPQGFPIGKVIHVEKKKYGITQKVIVEPHVRTNRLDEVFVVLKATNELL